MIHGAILDAQKAAFGNKRGVITATKHDRITVIMKIKKADYTFAGGSTVQYDADAPCLCCKEPVESASMGGTAICPACDCGVHRDTRQQWTWQEAFLICRDKITPQEARELCKPVPFPSACGFCPKR